MAKSFLTSLDLNKNELQNARVQNLATAPSSPVTGQIYYDTDDNKLYWWNGSSWVDATGGAGGISSTIVDAKGDLIVGTAADTVARLAIGSNGTLPVAASGETTGIEWRTLTESDINLSATDRLVGRDTASGGVAEELTVGGGIEFTGAGGIQTSAFTGDVTKSAGGTATTIANDAVTNAQAANMAQSTIKGRAAAAGTGDPTDLTAAQVKTILALAGSEITFAPADTIAATDVQSAIVEALTDARAYADSVATGLDVKASVRAATTGAGTLASSFENGDTLDGVTLATGDRILIKDQAAGAENGIYTVNASGAPTRAADANTSAEVTGGLSVWVNEGTTNGDSQWVLTTNDTITLGTTALVFSQVSGLGQITAGNALTKTGNTLDVAPGTGLEISSDTIRIAAAAAGSGLTGGAGSALAVGAGTGITVNADDVALDTTVAVRKFAADCAAATSTVVTHNLGTRDVTVSVVRASTPWDHVVADVESTSTNTVTVRFAVAPSAAEYRIVVHG